MREVREERERAAAARAPGVDDSWRCGQGGHRGSAGEGRRERAICD
jgi:hypothetical protein